MKKNITLWFITIILLLSVNTVQARDIMKFLWGEPALEPTLGLGMWSLHLKHEQRSMSNGHNNLVGFGYNGYFIATLTNSQSRRSVAVGLQRYVFTKQLKPDLTYQLGYRLGLVYGYNKRFGWIADKIPVLPFPQIILSDITWKKHFGWELSYTWVVISTGFYYRF